MKDMIKRIREEREGFTLAELLIVVAIIAVLVAIAIPVFNSQLEKSREAVDLANIRTAYAEVMTASLTNEKPTANNTNEDGVSFSNNTWSKTIDLTQKQDNWQTDVTSVKIGTASLSSTLTAADGTATVSYNATDGAKVEFGTK